MTYHINKIVNSSPKSISIVNPASNSNGRDSRVWVPGTHPITNPIKINYIETSPVTYGQALPTAINIYTYKDNTFFWDTGNSAINGVAESAPNTDLSLYNGSGGEVTLTIDSSGALSFKASS